MRYILQHIKDIIEAYDGSLPLSHFLKKYLRKYPKLGSRDRKVLTEMAYCWYRCEKGLPGHLSFEEKLKAALLLCGNRQKYILPFLPDNWRDMEIADLPFDAEKLFQQAIGLSDGIERQAWLSSMLVQPDLFIRIRKNKDGITAILNENEIPFRLVSDNCMALPNATAIDKLLAPEDYVIHDASSQKTGSYFQVAPGEAWYDCCSGAGGKSLLLKDVQPAVQLTVSDKRETILYNLEERFRLYGHALPASHLLDVADKQQLQQVLGGQSFDGIIADVPCTGSGTWARTPEQAYYFNPADLAAMSSLQKQILLNTSELLKPGARLYYITCSVFTEENEMVVEHAVKQADLTVREMHLINGLEQKADSMFIAVLER